MAFPCRLRRILPIVGIEMQPSEAIELSGSITLGDFLRFYYFHMFKKSWGFALAFPVFLLALARYFTIHPDSAMRVPLLLGTDLVYTAYFVAVPYWSARSAFKTTAFTDEPLSYNFGPD